VESPLSSRLSSPLSSSSSPSDGAPGTGDVPLLQDLLQKTSRTFALTIPLLPEPTRTEVGVAYLLFRIIDTFEDATNWPAARRIEALGQMIRLLDERDLAQAGVVAARWTQRPPLAHPGYLELLAATPRVLAWHRKLAPAACAHIGAHVTRSAQGMSEFVGRTDGQGMLQLDTMQELRDYCFAVAGIVGEMLTELFVLGTPTLTAVAAELRARSRRFGEALQLVNILKDVQPDANEGRRYLPREVSLAEVFALARADLRAAGEYTEILRDGGADRGLVVFNALNARLGIATLRTMRDRGLGAKLTRAQVLALAAEVVRAAEHGAPLFDPKETDG
jgi:farnesyl-diphosphate farnesyltransferase